MILFRPVQEMLFVAALRCRGGAVTWHLGLDSLRPCNRRHRLGLEYGLPGPAIVLSRVLSLPLFGSGYFLTKDVPIFPCCSVWLTWSYGAS